MSLEQARDAHILPTLFAPRWDSSRARQASDAGEWPERAPLEEEDVDEEGVLRIPSRGPSTPDAATQRRNAVLMSSYRHRVNGDGFHWPGRTGLMIARCDPSDAWAARDGTCLFCRVLHP